MVVSSGGIFCAGRDSGVCWEMAGIESMHTVKKNVCRAYAKKSSEQAMIEECPQYSRVAAAEISD
jgi:hypothetical protein